MAWRHSAGWVSWVSGRRALMAGIGTHLNGAGYHAWVDVLRPYLSHLAAPAAPADLTSRCGVARR